MLKQFSFSVSQQRIIVLLSPVGAIQYFKLTFLYKSVTNCLCVFECIEILHADPRHSDTLYLHEEKNVAGTYWRVVKHLRRRTILPRIPLFLLTILSSVELWLVVLYTPLRRIDQSKNIQAAAVLIPSRQRFWRRNNVHTTSFWCRVPAGL